MIEFKIKIPFVDPKKKNRFILKIRGLSFQRFAKINLPNLVIDLPFLLFHHALSLEKVKVFRKSTPYYIYLC
jgi:hypothetical protein